MNKAIPELLNLANGSAAAGDTVARQVCVVAIDEIESLQRLLRQCTMLAMKDDGEDSTVAEMHAVPLEDIPDFINSRIADLECEAASAESLQADTAKLVEALDCAEGAIADAIGCEDGLDGATGYAALTMLWPLMDAHGVMARPRQRAKFQAMYEGHAKVKRDIVSVENAELQCEAVQHNTEYLEMSELLAKRGREIEDLQAVVKQLPKTADGVPVAPGMKVFYRHAVGGTIYSDVIADLTPYSTDPESSIWAGGEIGVDQCYSTEAAARAAGESER